MPSRLIQLKDIDSSPNDLLFPITTGEAVSVTFDGTSHSLQSVVDLIPTADGGGGSGSTQTVAGKTVILGTTGKAVVTVNGLDSGTVALPDLCPWPISLGNIDNSGAITGGTVAPASGQNLAVTDTTGLVIRSSIAFDTTDTSKYLRHDGTWQAVSSGVSTHTLLSSSAHTDTINGSPTDGNIIVGNGSKWTSQSFETFANTYHAVPLVGHFDSTNFNAWFVACISGILNGNIFYNSISDVINDNPSLSYITIDISFSDILSAITSGRPVYLLATADLEGLGAFKFVFEPKLNMTQDQNNAVIFSSSCGYEFIGGIDVQYSSDVDGNGNPGGGLIILPRFTSEAVSKITALPSDSDAIAYQSITIGSDTTKYLRNDGQWVVPTSGSGGTTVTLPSGYSASTGITLNSSSLTTVATIGDTELKLKAPAGGSGGTTVTLPSGYSASTGITLNSSSLTTVATIGDTELKLKAPAGGSGSWSPELLTSGFRIWNLSTGIYQMPASGQFYYDGASGNGWMECTGGLLFVYEEGLNKQWFIFTDYTSGSSTSGLQFYYAGYTNSSSGTYTMRYLTTTNGGDRSIGFGSTGTSGLSVNNSYFYDPGITYVQYASPWEGGPTNLTPGEVTRAILVVTRNYNPGNYYGSDKKSRQDFIVPSLGRHWYRYVTRTTESSNLVADTTVQNCDANGWVEVLSIPRYTSSEAGKYLKVSTGGTSLEWATVSGGSGGSSTLSGLTDTTISNPANKQALIYDSNSSKWVNSSIIWDQNMHANDWETATGEVNPDGHDQGQPCAVDFSTDSSRRNIWFMGWTGTIIPESAGVGPNGEHLFYLDFNAAVGLGDGPVDHYLVIFNESGDDVILSVERLQCNGSDVDRSIIQSINNGYLPTLPDGEAAILCYTVGEIPAVGNTVGIVSWGGNFSVQ